MIILRRPATTASTPSNVVVADTVSGTQDGSNYTYTTSFDYRSDRIHISYNGQMLSSPDDFSETASNEIQLVSLRPVANDILRATYETSDTSYVLAGLLSGVEAIPIGVTSKVVSFGQTLDNTNYRLSTVLVTTTPSNPDIYDYVINNKTTTGFTIVFSGEIDTNNYSLEWMITNY